LIHFSLPLLKLCNEQSKNRFGASLERFLYLNFGLNYTFTTRSFAMLKIKPENKLEIKNKIVRMILCIS